MRRGVFITIDGIDGSGKTTQNDLLIARLQKSGIALKKIKFPQYHQSSAWQIEQYLNGFFGPLDGVDPYFASILYADDRKEASHKIRKWLKSGFLVLADRYVTANAGHQGGKITDSKKRKRYLGWLLKTEFEINKIPIPDINIILWVPPALAHKLIFLKNRRSYLKKRSKRDGHERNLSHLKRAAASYIWVAKRDPKHFELVNCMRNGKLLSPEEIHEKIWQIVKTFLKVKEKTA